MDEQTQRLLCDSRDKPSTCQIMSDLGLPLPEHGSWANAIHSQVAGDEMGWWDDNLSKTAMGFVTLAQQTADAGRSWSESVLIASEKTTWEK